MRRDSTCDVSVAAATEHFPPAAALSLFSRLRRWHFGLLRTRNQMMPSIILLFVDWQVSSF